MGAPAGLEKSFPIGTNCSIGKMGISKRSSAETSVFEEFIQKIPREKTE